MAIVPVLNIKIMYNNYETDKNSFTGSLNNIIRALDINGTIISTENDNHPISILLDRFCGIDAFIQDEIGVFGIAARIQAIEPDKKSFDTFTIRSQRSSGVKTEYQKRVESISNNYFYPTYTIQGFVKKDTQDIISCAAIKTIDLYDFIKQHSYKVKENWSENKFMCVLWSDLELAEYPIKIYHSDSKKKEFSHNR